LRHSVHARCAAHHLRIVLVGISCALFTDNGTIDEAVAGMRGLLSEQLTTISSLSCLKSIERKNATHVGTIHLGILRC